MTKAITISRIAADDFFSTLEVELAEPIPGEEFDFLPEDERLSWGEEFALLNRRDKREWGKPSGKPRSKK
jgi:hypothetical protein